MFVKINYILAIALLFLISACGNSEKTFKDMDSVIKALEKHNVTDCNEIGVTVAQLGAGAVNVVVCDVTSSGSVDTKGEFSFWEEDNAKNACVPTIILDVCLEGDFEDWASLRFYGNIHVFVYDEENGVTIDSIISDLDDGLGSVTQVE